MTLERLFEILRETGGEVLASQESYERIFNELEGRTEVGKFATIKLCGVEVIWSRYPFHEAMKIESAKAVAISKIQKVN